jgi:hypothetical protein
LAGIIWVACSIAIRRINSAMRRKLTIIE